MPDTKLDKKKILILVGFIVVSLALAFLIVWVFFLQGGPTSTSPAPGTPGGQLPGTGSGGFGSGTTFPIGSGTTAPDGSAQIDQIAQGGLTNLLPLSKDRVIGATLTGDGRDVSFYDPGTGQFFRLSNDGRSKTLMTDETFFSVQSVAWSANKNKAVLEFPDGANIVYDFNSRSSVTLPPETVDHVFAPNTDNLAFKIETENDDDNWLVMTDSQGGNPNFIEPIGDRGDLVQVAFSPNEEVIAVYHKPIGPAKEEIFMIGKSGENFKSFFVDGLNFKGKFSPDGQRMLYHVMAASDLYNPSLWIVDVRGLSVGLNKFALNLETWVDKCTFSKNNRHVYCAAPRSLAAGTGLSVGAEKTTNDIFYRVDLDTGLKKLIAEPANASGPIEVAVTDIWLDSNEQYIFFWDGLSGGIYRLQLE